MQPSIFNKQVPLTGRDDLFLNVRRHFVVTEEINGERSTTVRNLAKVHGITLNFGERDFGHDYCVPTGPLVRTA